MLRLITSVYLSCGKQNYLNPKSHTDGKYVSSVEVSIYKDLELLEKHVLGCMKHSSLSEKGYFSHTSWAAIFCVVFSFSLVASSSYEYANMLISKV